jgi:DNA sulfur modification protein DndD
MEVIETDAGQHDVARMAREAIRADGTLARFSSRIIARNVDRISQHITDSLHLLLRKQGLISEVTIEPHTLAINLHGSDGTSLDPTRLSAGERQMLATAVLWGLSKSTGRILPTIIDTPVGRLDRSHRTNLVERYFPNASRQVVLLSTDEEIVGDYLKRLTPFIGARYELSYDDHQKATTIRTGYFR